MPYRKTFVITILVISLLIVVILLHSSIIKALTLTIMEFKEELSLLANLMPENIQVVMVNILILITSIAIVYQILKRITSFIVLKIGGRQADVKMLLKLIRTTLAIIAIFLIINQFYRIEALLLALGAFTGLFLGWALQQPITGIAAWIFINVKRPFRIGDRIYLPQLGLVGDVMDVGIFHTILNQVGGTVGSEEASGRIILVPNAIFFSTTIINYTYTSSEEKSYILDEIVVRLSFDSDLEVAERILVHAAEEVTKDIIRETGVKPYIRAELWDYGILVRLRYYTRAKDRVIIAHEITKRIVKEFQRNDKVDFAIPFIYSFRLGEALKRAKRESITIKRANSEF